jgi:hypothetical protein
MLEYLDCSENALSQLTFDENYWLIELYCYSNNLSSLIVHENNNLETLDCAYNKFTELNIIGCSALQAMDFSHNNLSTIQIGAAGWRTGPLMEALICSYNNLSILDLNYSVRLRWIDLTYNHFSSEGAITISGLQSPVGDAGIQFLPDLGIDQQFLDMDNVTKDLPPKQHTTYCHITEPHTHTVLFDPQYPTKFSDVFSNSWFVGDVIYALNNNLFTGVSDAEFAPNLPMTRRMLVTVMHRFAGKPNPVTQSSFADVQAGQYYTAAVAWAAENKIVNGLSQAEFAPNSNVTREQFATIIYRYAKDYLKLNVSNTAGLGFADSASVSAYATDAVKWCVAGGIIRGKDGNLFDPQASATRAEVAAMVHRFAVLTGK